MLSCQVSVGRFQPVHCLPRLHDNDRVAYGYAPAYVPEDVRPGINAGQRSEPKARSGVNDASTNFMDIVVTRLQGDSVHAQNRLQRCDKFLCPGLQLHGRSIPGMEIHEGFGKQDSGIGILRKLFPEDSHRIRISLVQYRSCGSLQGVALADCSDIGLFGEVTWAL